MWFFYNVYFTQCVSSFVKKKKMKRKNAVLTILFHSLYLFQSSIGQDKLLSQNKGVNTPTVSFNGGTP